MKKRLLLLALLSIIVLAGCGGQPDLSDKINDLARPYAFSLLRWEMDMISQEIDQHVRRPWADDSTDPAVVRRYFDFVARENGLRQQIQNIQGGFAAGSVSELESQLDAVGKERLAVERQAEEVLARQMSLAAAELGIYNPLDSYWSVRATFPPVSLRLQEPPQLLVVSPRQKIDRVKSVTLDSSTSPVDAAALEDAVAALDLSAIVVGLGGIATYPSFVNNNYGLATALDIAAEEWFHQYLFFRPLGFRYALDELGFDQPLDIFIMNETLAGMVAGELAARVNELFYGENQQTSIVRTAQPAYDFNAEMRRTRATVDVLLADGKVAEAEAYMESRRQEFAQHGYYIRKLNQAYFAFYGSYANLPGFGNPIGDDLQALRKKSATLAEFVQTASALTSRDALSQAVR